MSELNYCFRCSAEITSKYGKKFCSNKCSREYATERSTLVTKKDKSYFCDYCGKIFERKDRRSKFCSRSCSAKYHNKIKSEKVRHKCPGCGSSILIRFVYCTPKCKTNHKIRQWLVGEFEATKKHSISKFIRDYLLEKSEYKCEKCRYDRKRDDGSSIIQIHHKDGNWQNSRPKNLECLCPNCHALTENYGARNMGQGRTWKKNYDQFAGVAKR